MKAPKADGFILVLVIVALGFTAVVMAVLTAGANTMLFHADRAQCEAVQRNLCVSGLAWARRCIAEPNRAVARGPVKLDTSALSNRSATLTVSFLTADDSTGQIQIETRCAKGRHALNTTDTYTVPPTR